MIDPGAAGVRAGRRAAVLLAGALVAFVSACGLCGLGGCGRSETPSERILLIVIDTLRRDHVSAYGSGPVRADLKDAEHTAIIKPWPLGRNHRLGDDQFTRDDFTIDYQTGTVTCPNQITVSITATGTATFGAKCRGCPLRVRCTAAVNGKTYRIGEHDQVLAAARAHWRNGDNLDDYRQP